MFFDNWSVFGKPPNGLFALCHYLRRRAVRVSQERFDQESPNVTRTSTPAHSTATPDRTSLAASGRLQNAINYYTKVRKTGAVGKESNNSIIVLTTITKFYNYIQVDLVYSHARYDITSYFRSAFIEGRKKTAENVASDGFGSIVVARRFAWPNQLVGFLFKQKRLTEQSANILRTTEAIQYLCVNFRTNWKLHYVKNVPLKLHKKFGHDARKAKFIVGLINSVAIMT